jgi:hypothetical protein
MGHAITAEAPAGFDMLAIDAAGAVAAVGRMLCRAPPVLLTAAQLATAIPASSSPACRWKDR